MKSAYAVLLVLLFASPLAAQNKKQLLADLEAKKAEQRIAAIKGLAKLKDAGTLEALGKVLAADKVPAVRLEAARALAQIDIEAAVPLLKEGLAGQADKLRLFVVKRLGSLADADLLPIFAERLDKDASSAVRQAALDALLRLRRSSEAVALGLKAIGSSDEAVALKALTWVAEVRPAGGRARLLAILDKQQGKRLAAALSALGGYRQLADAGRLVTALGNKSESVRRAAYEALKGYGERIAYDPAKPADKQADALARWKKWWREKKATLQTEERLFDRLVDYADQNWRGKRKLVREFEQQRDLALKVLARGLQQKQEKVQIAAAELCERVGGVVLLGDLSAALSRATKQPKLVRALLRGIQSICAREPGLTARQRADALKAVDAAYDGAEADVRRAVVRAVAVIGPEEGLATLARVLLKDKDARLREDAAGHLGRRGFVKAVPPLATALTKDKERRVRSGAARALTRVRGNKAFEALLGAYPAEKEDVVRADILWGLRETKDRRAVPVFLEGLTATSVSVRAAAAAGLKHFAGRDMGFIAHGNAEQRARGVEKWRGWWRLERASRNLGSSDAAQVAGALETLKAGGADALPVLVHLLGESDSAVVKRRAIGLLGSIEDPRAAWVLVDLIEDADRQVRLEAVAALSRSGGAGVARLVASRYRRATDAGEKLALAAALIALGDAGVVRADLRRIVEEDKAPAAERQQALAALCKTGDPQEGALLRDVLAGKVAKGLPRAREQAILGLGRIDTDASRDALLTLAGGNVEADAVAALVSLREGKQQKAASAVLALAKKSTSVPVRLAACRLLGAFAEKGAADYLAGLAGDAKQAEGLRVAAARALARAGSAAQAAALGKLAADAKEAPGLRAAAADAALRLDAAGQWGDMAKLASAEGPADLLAAVVRHTPKRPGSAWLARLVTLAGAKEKPVSDAAIKALRSATDSAARDAAGWKRWLARRRAVEAALTKLASKKAAEREQAVAALEKIGAPAIPGLLRFATDGAHAVEARALALGVAGRVGTERDAARLARLLGELRQVALRRAALAAYARTVGKRDLAKLLGRYQGARGVERAILAGGAYRLGGSTLQQVVLAEAARELRKGDGGVAGALLEWLGTADDAARARCSSALLQLAGGSEPSLRARALAAYAPVADRRELSRMVGWLAATDLATRKQALAIIRRHAPAALTFDPAADAAGRKKALGAWQAWWTKNREALELGGRIDRQIDGLLHGDAARREGARAELVGLLRSREAAGRQLALAAVERALDRSAGADEGAGLGRLVDASRAAHDVKWAERYQKIALQGGPQARPQAARALRDLQLPAATYTTVLEKSADPEVQLYALMGLTWQDVSEPGLREQVARRLPDLIFPPKTQVRPAQLSAEAMRLAGEWRIEKVAPTIAGLLTSKPASKLQRRVAAWALGRLGLEKGIKQLIDLLMDGEREVREEAISALTRVTGAGDFDFRADGSDDARRRAQVQWRRWWMMEQARQKVDQALAEYHKQEKPKLSTLAERIRHAGLAAVEMVLERLETVDADGQPRANLSTPSAERQLLCRVLGELKQPVAREALIRRLADPDPAVRKAAADAFFASVEKWATGRPAYETKAPPYGLDRQATRVALAWSLEEEARADRRRLLGRFRPFVRELFGAGAEVDKLARAGDARLREAFAILLGHQRTRRSVGRLVELAGDKEAAVAQAAERSLGLLTGQKLKGAKAWKEWVDANRGAALKSATDEQAAADVVRLRALGAKLVSRLIAQADPAKQTSDRLRDAAMRALGLLREAAVITPLIQGLSDSSRRVREQAYSSLVGATGQTFRFRAAGPPARRKAAVAKWEAWHKSNPTFFAIEDKQRKEREAQYAEAAKLLTLTDAARISTLWKPMASPNLWLRRAAYEAFLALTGPIHRAEGLSQYNYENTSAGQRKTNLEHLQADWKAELALRAEQKAAARSLDGIYQRAGKQWADVVKLSKGKSPFERRLAAALAAGVPTADAAKLLAGLLGDSALAVKLEALEGLRFLSGKSFGSDESMPGGDREVMAKWRDWAAKADKLTAPVASDAAKSARLATLRELATRCKDNPAAAALVK